MPAPEVSWSPTLSASDNAIKDSSPTYERDRDFAILTTEPGKTPHDSVPLYRSARGAVHFEDAVAADAVQHEAVPGVAGAFVLTNVLSSNECMQIKALATAMKFRCEGSFSRGRPIRRNENLLWIADDSLWLPIWARIARFMPTATGTSSGGSCITAAGAAACGLNRRWRVYRYRDGDDFAYHHDGSWPESLIDEESDGALGGTLVRDSGRALSELTLLLALDEHGDEYDGGETTFLVDGMRIAVKLPRGAALCFCHGEHPLSPLHEGSEVTRGIKHVIRSDVLYPLLGRGDDGT